MERIKEIILNAQEYEDEKKAAVLTLIENIDDAESLLGEKIKNSKIYSSLNESVGALKEECNNYANRNAALENEVTSLNVELEEVRHKLSNEASALQNKNTEDLMQKNDLLSEENAALKEKLVLVEENSKLEEINNELEETNKNLIHTYEVLTIQVNEKTKELKTIQENVKNAIQKGVDEASIAKNAFDPHLANAMMDAAEQWRSDSEIKHYEEIVEELSNLEIEKIEKEVLIDNLVKHVQKFRNYKKNDIINIYICMAQNFLTIFSGEPGTGKTSICNIIANSLGLNNFGIDKNSEVSKNRYVPVSVERGWSSKRDLIGYYNPLTRKYDRSNAKIYDSLMIMNREREKSRFPYLILLDEANLSQMEYYWADFMRVADKNAHNMFINIGMDNDIYIPETLHFLATINNDQTTEELSPRLVDRAWIIKLPNVEVKEIPETVEDCRMDIVLWEDIKNAFITTNNTEMQLKPVIDQIYKLFENNHLTVSPRVQQSIKNYICIAQEIMEDEQGISKKAKALDFAITQKLLPKIDGYYDNYKRLFDSLMQICDDNNLKMTKEALDYMQESANQNMGYCKYLV